MFATVQGHGDKTRGKGRERTMSPSLLSSHPDHTHFSNWVLVPVVPLFFPQCVTAMTVAVSTVVQQLRSLWTEQSDSLEWEQVTPTLVDLIVEVIGARGSKKLAQHLQKAAASLTLDENVGQPTLPTSPKSGPYWEKLMGDILAEV